MHDLHLLRIDHLSIANQLVKIDSVGKSVSVDCQSGLTVCDHFSKKGPTGQVNS